MSTEKILTVANKLYKSLQVVLLVLGIASAIAIFVVQYHDLSEIKSAKVCLNEEQAKPWAAYALKAESPENWIHWPHGEGILSEEFQVEDPKDSANSALVPILLPYVAQESAKKCNIRRSSSGAAHYYGVWGDQHPNPQLAWIGIAVAALTLPIWGARKWVLWVLKD